MSIHTGRFIQVCKDTHVTPRGWLMNRMTQQPIRAQFTSAGSEWLTKDVQTHTRTHTSLCQGILLAPFILSQSLPISRSFSLSLARVLYHFKPTLQPLQCQTLLNDLYCDKNHNYCHLAKIRKYYMI